MIGRNPSWIRRRIINGDIDVVKQCNAYLLNQDHVAALRHEACARDRERDQALTVAVAKAPPVSKEQREHLASLLQPVDTGK